MRTLRFTLSIPLYRIYFSSYWPQSLYPKAICVFFLALCPQTLPKSGNNGNHLILGVDVSVMIHEGVNGGDGRDA